jgi:hypothetical protein
LLPNATSLNNNNPQQCFHLVPQVPKKHLQSHVLGIHTGMAMVCQLLIVLLKSLLQQALMGLHTHLTHLPLHFKALTTQAWQLLLLLPTMLPPLTLLDHEFLHLLRYLNDHHQHLISLHPNPNLSRKQHLLVLQYLPTPLLVLLYHKPLLPNTLYNKLNPLQKSFNLT